MVVLSLFDGISCGNYILKHLLGIDNLIYYSSEINSTAIKIANKNFPEQIQLGDIKYWNSWDIDWEKIDLILAGSPCQSFSNAGKRLGFEGQSGKITYLFDILKHTRKNNPKIKFFLENTCMHKNNKDIISKELQVEPVEVNSSLFSAQQRKRLYWSNINLNLQSSISKCLYVKDILEGHVEDKYYLQGISDISLLGPVKPTNKPVKIGQIGKGGQGERIYSIEGKSVCLTANGGGRGAKTGLYALNNRIRKLTPIECERLQGLPDNYTLLHNLKDTPRYKVLGNAWQCDTIATLLSCDKGLEYEIFNT